METKCPENQQMKKSFVERKLLKSCRISAKILNKKNRYECDVPCCYCCSSLPCISTAPSVYIQQDGFSILLQLHHQHQPLVKWPVISPVLYILSSYDVPFGIYLMLIC